MEHKYNTQRQHVVEERELPGEVRDLRECNCDRPLQTYGMAQAGNAYGQAPKYVKIIAAKFARSSRGSQQ